MQLGRFTIEQLSEGQFELFTDGKINRTPVSDTNPIRVPGESTSGLMGINPVYITDGSNHILLDTGLGWGLDAGSGYADVSNVCSNLDIFGVSPQDITHVILSHLHYDHAAGASFTDANAKTCPTFPNAQYLLRQDEWDFAVSQTQQHKTGNEFYNLDDLYRLYSEGYFRFIDTDSLEIIPGITLYKTGGHTPGHQVVRIEDEDRCAYYLGDLVPSGGELNHDAPSMPHANAQRLKKCKTQILREAHRKEAFLLFYHSVRSKIARLEEDEAHNYILKDTGEDES